MSDIQEALTDLKAELEQMPTSSHKTRLENLVRRLETEVDAETELSPEVYGVLEQFEVEHPQLVQVLNRIAVTLSDMGI